MEQLTGASIEDKDQGLNTAEVAAILADEPEGPGGTGVMEPLDTSEFPLDVPPPRTGDIGEVLVVGRASFDECLRQIPEKSPGELANIVISVCPELEDSVPFMDKMIYREAAFSRLVELASLEYEVGIGGFLSVDEVDMGGTLLGYRVGIDGLILEYEVDRDKLFLDDEITDKVLASIFVLELVSMYYRLQREKEMEMTEIIDVKEIVSKRDLGIRMENNKNFMRVFDDYSSQYLLEIEPEETGPVRAEIAEIKSEVYSELLLTFDRRGFVHPNLFDSFLYNLGTNKAMRKLKEIMDGTDDELKSKAEELLGVLSGFGNVYVRNFADNLKKPIEKKPEKMKFLEWYRGFLTAAGLNLRRPVSTKLKKVVSLDRDGKLLSEAGLDWRESTRMKPNHTELKKVVLLSKSGQLVSHRRVREKKSVRKASDK